MIEIFKDVLFNAFGYVGVTACVLGLGWLIIRVFVRYKKLYKVIIQAREWQKNKYYIDKDNIILDKNGKSIRYMGYDKDEEIEIYNKAIKRCEKVKELQEKYKKS